MGKPSRIPPIELSAGDSAVYREAAAKALLLFPGAIGRNIAAEILTWEDLGYRLPNGSVHELVSTILGIKRLVWENLDGTVVRSK